MGKQWKQCQTLFFWAPKSLQIVTAAMKWKDAYSWKESYEQLRQNIKKQRHYFINKDPCNQSHGFSSSHLWMWQLDHKGAECWRIYAFEVWCWRRLLRVPWYSRRWIQSILKEINPEYSLHGQMLELKLQYLGNWLIGKDPDAMKDWGGRRRGQVGEMVGWYHQHDGHEFE